MKISVIIPTYNEEKYIEKTLLAIKNQTFKDYEIIVVDSNSPDKTRKIAKKYADKFINIKKRGISLSRNVGARYAKGDILLFLDADTVLDKNFLTLISKTFKDKDVVCASGYIKTYGKLSHRFIFKAAAESAYILSKINKPAFYGICLAIRKSIFKKIKGFNEKFHTAEDIDLTKNASKYGKCVFLRDAIATTSPRRLIGMGYFNTIVFHIKNFIYYKVFRKPSRHYSVVRSE